MGRIVVNVDNVHKRVFEIACKLLEVTTSDVVRKAMTETIEQARQKYGSATFAAILEG